MHDDPTRIMGQPGDPGHRPRGNMRLLIAGLIAVIDGLVVAIVVIASDNSNDVTVDSERPLDFSTLSTGETSTPTTTGSTTTETSEPTTETTTEPTTAPPTTAPEEEENGSGGIPAE